MRDRFSYAMLTEIAKVLLIMLLLFSVQYIRQTSEPGNGPRDLTRAETAP